MRTELWGLRNKETNELVLEYWASSQKHKALFSSYDRAQEACNWKHNMHLEPFKIEPVVHGKWIWDTKGLYPKPLCSRCSEEPCRLTNHQDDLPKYCPACGAKMDLEG